MIEASQGLPILHSHWLEHDPTALQMYTVNMTTLSCKHDLMPLHLDMYATGCRRWDKRSKVNCQVLTCIILCFYKFANLINGVGQRLASITHFPCIIVNANGL